MKVRSLARSRAFFVLAMSGALSSLLVACAYRNDKAATLTGAGSPLSASTVSYAQVRDQVFEGKCKKCHSNFMDFSGAHDSLDEIKSKVFEKHSMPPSSEPQLAQNELALLQTWIQEGGPETAGTGAVSTEPAATGATGPTGPSVEDHVTWEIVQKQFFGKHCLTCHGGPDAEDDPDLSDYATVKSKILDIVRIAFVRKKMPPARTGDHLTDEDRAIVSGWFFDGMPGPVAATGVTGATGQTGPTGN